VLLKIRCMVRADLAEVLDIESRCYPEFPWDEDTFLSALCRRNCIGMVAENQGRIAGFMVYELHKARLRLLNFAVDPAYQRNRVGTQLIGRLKEKLKAQGRREVVLEVRERNLPAQLFWKAQGFMAVCCLHCRYEETDEDSIWMRYVLPGCPDDRPFAPHNRISQWLEPVE
jgi:ribosomal-protein-alanine N-acetyltransferase